VALGTVSMDYKISWSLAADPSNSSNSIFSGVVDAATGGWAAIGLGPSMIGSSALIAKPSTSSSGGSPASCCNLCTWDPCKGQGSQEAGFYFKPDSRDKRPWNQFSYGWMNAYRHDRKAVCRHEKDHPTWDRQIGSEFPILCAQLESVMLGPRCDGGRLLPGRL
jgi:hypothetical protein